MRAVARARFVRVSARKAGLVLRQIRGKPVAEALATLQFTPRAAARLVEKVLRSAVANAEHNHQVRNLDDLRVVQATADVGPSLKRVQPRAMGRAFFIRHRTSHLTVAVSDEPGLTVRGVGVVKRVGGRRDLDAIARLLAPHAPERIVVGLPLNMDGTEGPRAAKTRAFGARVAAHLGLPVEFWDERLTTVEAEQLLREAGVPARRRRARLDAAAASVILRDYLAARK